MRAHDDKKPEPSEDLTIQDFYNLLNENLDAISLNEFNRKDFRGFHHIIKTDDPILAFYKSWANVFISLDILNDRYNKLAWYKVHRGLFMVRPSYHLYKNLKVAIKHSKDIDIFPNLKITWKTLLSFKDLSVLKIKSALNTLNQFNDALNKTQNLRDSKNVIVENNEQPPAISCAEKIGTLARNINELRGKSYYEILTSLPNVISSARVTKKILAANLPHLQYKTHQQTIKELVELNTSLKELMLHLDKTEIQLHLKEGLLFPEELNSILKEFNDVLPTIGYEFQSNNRFPYRENILEQRKTLLDSKPLHSLSYRKTKLENEIKTAENKTVQEQKDIQKRTRQASLKLIDQRIAELQNESFCKNSFTRFFSNIFYQIYKKERKIVLLQRLYIRLEKNMTLDNALNIFTPKQKELIFSGRTGKTLKEVSEVYANREYVCNLIRVRITTLIREKNQLLIRTNAREKAFSEKISALGLLKMILEQDGCKIDEALEEIRSAKETENYYKILTESENEVINKISGIEKLHYQNKIGLAMQRKLI